MGVEGYHRNVRFLFHGSLFPPVLEQARSEVEIDDGFKSLMSSAKYIGL